MIITEIIPVNKKKCRIVTDEQLAFVLYKGELSYFKLQEGVELSAEKFEMILQEKLIKRAKIRAMHLLTGRSYTENELRRKLNMGEYTVEAVEAAITYVKDYHYLDDTRYAEDYIRLQAEKKGKRQIQYELERKGISRELIAQCMEAQEEVVDERLVIRQLLEKKCKNLAEADEKEIRRIYGWLMRKGFRSSDIQSALSQSFELFD